MFYVLLIIGYNTFAMEVFFIYFYLNCIIDDCKSKTVVGSSFTNTTVDVNIDASNYNVEITFRITDTNGGTANWTCY